MSFQNRRRVLLEESKLTITTTAFNNQEGWGVLGQFQNDGPTLKWEVDNNGSITTKYGDTPFFNMYGLNSKYVNVTDVVGVKKLGIYSMKITLMDVSQMIYLHRLNVASNLLSQLDISSNTELTFLDVSDNNLTAQSLDKIIIDLDNNGKINGNLYYDANTRSLSSNSAKSSLISKGWNIVEVGGGLSKPK